MTISHRLATTCAVLILAATSAHAQIPDTYTNLKVLPKNITKPELIKVMRGFSSDLGVRCSHCHEGRDPHDLSTFNFASDQKPAKDTARIMMRLASDINAKLDKDLSEKDPDHLGVTCFTCHHGNERPETLADALVPLMKKEGPNAAVARYHELRNEYFGQAAYDFSEWSLVTIAEELAHDPAQIEGARELLMVNLEFYPESAATYARIAETYIAAGDTATALTNFDRAMVLAPQDPWIKRRVDLIRSGGSSGGEKH